VPFNASLRGSLAQSGPDNRGNTTITIRATLSSGATGSLLIVLNGPADSGGVRMAASSVTLGTAAQPGLYKGHIVQLGGTRIVATMTGPTGQAATLDVALQIDQSGTAVTGTASATPGAPTGRGN